MSLGNHYLDAQGITLPKDVIKSGESYVNTNVNGKNYSGQISNSQNINNFVRASVINSQQIQNSQVINQQSINKQNVIPTDNQNVNYINRNQMYRNVQTMPSGQATFIPDNSVN